MRFTITFKHIRSGRRFRRSFNSISRDECLSAAEAYLIAMGHNPVDWEIRVGR